MEKLISTMQSSHWRHFDDTYPYQYPLPVYSLFVELDGRGILDENTVRHRQEGPDSLVRHRGDIEAGILQGLGVLVDQAAEDRRVLRLEAVRGPVEAAGVRGKCKVGLRWDPICVSVLLRQVG